MYSYELRPIYSSYKHNTVAQAIVIFLNVGVEE